MPIVSFSIPSYMFFFQILTTAPAPNKFHILATTENLGTMDITEVYDERGLNFTIKVKESGAIFEQFLTRQPQA
jgi:hypothetical protein